MDENLLGNEQSFGIGDITSKIVSKNLQNMVDELFKTLDLDKNGELDKEQAKRWCDVYAHLATRFDEAVDQEKIVGIIHDFAITSKEVLEYINKVKATLPVKPAK